MEKNVPVVPPGGKHMILDLWTSDPKLLGYEKWIKEICLAAATKAGATFLNSHFHKFGENQGVTGVIVLAESHISVHSWPETGYIAIDVFMCGNCDPETTLNIFLNGFKAKKYAKRIFHRGENTNK